MMKTFTILLINIIITRQEEYLYLLIKPKVGVGLDQIQIMEITVH